MTYHLRYSQTAERKLAGLPPHLLDFLEARLQELAESPTAHSRPAVFPFPPSSQMAASTYRPTDPGESAERLIVFFKFAQDEEHLYILDVGRITYPPTE